MLILSQNSSCIALKKCLTLFFSELPSILNMLHHCGEFELANFEGKQELGGDRNTIKKTSCSWNSDLKQKKLVGVKNPAHLMAVSFFP